MKYHSHGKLLIAGEYLVLLGATALAVPVNFGQSLRVGNNELSDNLSWESYENGKSWFTADFSNNPQEIVKTSDEKIARNLIAVLKYAMELNPGFQDQVYGKKVISDADFNLAWGLGSSSSLVSNIAYWANVDPFVLHKGVSQGSGFDVVTARAERPVFFKKKRNGYELNPADFNPEFKNKIFFIYLGSKQDSSESVSKFRLRKRSLKTEQNLISQLSQHIALSKQIEDFEYYLKEHELIISAVLKMKSIKETRFDDLNGEIKSLGAWGGDFAMMTWHGNREELKDYLRTKKINTVFSFDEMVKTR
jgi:mevalonate kinase